MVHGLPYYQSLLTESCQPGYAQLPVLYRLFWYSGVYHDQKGLLVVKTEERMEVSRSESRSLYTDQVVFRARC